MKEMEMIPMMRVEDDDAKVIRINKFHIPYTVTLYGYVQKSFSMVLSLKAKYLTGGHLLKLAVEESGYADFDNLKKPSKKPVRLMAPLYVADDFIASTDDPRWPEWLANELSE
jgi:hypothetical protein